MIRLRRIGACMCPFIVCDFCGTEILDYRQGVAVWTDSDELQHLHKIRCDHKTAPYWCDLAEHLHDLLFNSGLKPEQLVIEAEEIERWR